MQKNLVLIVEEDPGVKDLAKDCLELFGHRVLAPETASEAVRVWNQRKKDILLVLFDLSMPDSSLFLRAMVRSDPAVKIIATSNGNHECRLNELFSRHASGFLKKPYRISELVRMVDQIQKAV